MVCIICGSVLIFTLDNECIFVFSIGIEPKNVSVSNIRHCPLKIIGILNLFLARITLVSYQKFVSTWWYSFKNFSHFSGISLWF